MKKLILIITFFIINIVSFTAQEVDEASVRSTFVSNALSNLGATYSNDKRMKNGYFDCSSYVNRMLVASGVAGGADGKSGAYGTTASMRASGLIKNISTSALKVGDLLNFKPQGTNNYGHVGIVVGVIDSCNVKMAHASSSRGTVVDTVNLCSGYWGNRYIGATSMTDILKANGLTPVNSNGEVVVSPVGDSVTIQAETGSSIAVDWDAIVEKYKDMLEEGYAKVLTGILILLSLLTVLEIMWEMFKIINKNSIENVLVTLVKILIRFGLFSYILTNIVTIISTLYNVFAKIGSMITRTEATTLNSVWAVGTKDGETVLSIMNTYQFSIWQLLTDSALFWENVAKFLLLIAVLVMIYIFLIMILFQMLFASVIFFMSIDLAFIFMPFNVNTITKRFNRVNPINTIIGAGTKLVIVTTFAGIVFKSLENASLSGSTIQELDFTVIFSFITIGFIMALLMIKIDKLNSYLLNGRA